MLVFETRVPADLLALSALRKDVSARLMPLGLPPHTKSALLLVVAEIGANAIRHAQPAAHSVGLALRLDGRMLTIEIEDDGGAFASFETMLAAARFRDSAALEEGGRGLGIVAGLCDDIQYQPGAPNRFIGRIALGHSRPVILVVEDSPVLLETYCAMLARDYRVLRAATLDDAIRIVCAERIDGIVTDLHLGGEQGCALVGILESDVERPPVPVLVITAERDAETLAAVARRGVEQVLSKPVNAAALREAVSSMLLRDSRQNARLFRYFGGNIDQQGEDRLPEHFGPFRLQAISGRAGFGRGDFLCTVEIPGGMRVLIADVMGHGLAAQLAGLQFKAALTGIHAALPGADAGVFLAAVSRMLAPGVMLPGTYLTMMVADLFTDGHVEIASAGHPRAISLIKGDVAMVVADGPLPGVIDDVSYRVTRLDPEPSDRLILLTDGVDPRSDNAGCYAPDWLAKTLRAGAGMAFSPMLARLEQISLAVLTHAPVDDWTMLVIERQGEVARDVLQAGGP